MAQNINSDRDSASRGELLRRQDNLSELNKVLELEKYEYDTRSNPAAQSQWSTGRACPQCKNSLANKEYRDETETLIVYCIQCGIEFMSDDVDNQSEIGDKIHRSIPDSLILSWMNAIRK